MTTASLFWHYVDYLGQPAVLLTIVTLVIPFYLHIFAEQRLKPSEERIRGCYRLGLYKRSNLDGQYDRHPGANHASEKAQIKALFTYPIKSCRGVELSASEIHSTGLKYDRVFTFAQQVPRSDNSRSKAGGGGKVEVGGECDHEWRFITMREFPKLALLRTELWVPDPRRSRYAKANDQAQKNWKSSPQERGRGIDISEGSKSTQIVLESDWEANGGCVVVRFPFSPDNNFLRLRTENITMRLPLIPTSARARAKQYTSEPLKIWKDLPGAINMTNEIDATALAKLRCFLGVTSSLALFRVEDRNKRAVTRSLPEHRREDEDYSIGFADAFPLHMLNLASVCALGDEMPCKSSPKRKLEARSFRANIYFSGPLAYDEDTWKKARMGVCIQPCDAVPREKSSSRSRSPASPKRLPHDYIETEGGYHIACRTARCKVPNVDPDTGVLNVNEPSTTLRRVRVVDEGAKPHAVLGVQAIPLFQQGVLRVGDEIEVLERGEHVYEKMFS